MQPVDRYLRKLGSALPAEQRDDIVRELSENIHSQMEDRETELGRPLNESEVENILKQHGHPLVVASRYRSDQGTLAFGRQLIGATLFPFYKKVLAFNLGITAAVILIVFTALLASGQSVGFGNALSTLMMQLLIQFAAVTIIFALMDRHLAKHPDRWDTFVRNPARHPALIERPKGPAVSRLESVSQLIALAVFVGWVRAVQSPFLVFGAAASFLKAAPVWHQMYAPVVVLILLGMVQAGINLVRPDWVLVRSLFRVFGRAALLAICYFVIKAGVWVVPANANVAASYREAAVVINQTVFWGGICVAVISILLLVRDVRRLISGTSNSSHSSSSSSSRKAAANS